MSYQVHKTVLFAALLSAAACITGAVAQDSQPQDEAMIYGNLHLGMYDDTFINSTPTVYQFGLFGGGKIAIEPIGSQFGVQIDAESQGTTSGLQGSSKINTGSQYDTLGVVHGTFAANDQLKFGIFGGYEDINKDITVSTTTDPLVALLGPYRTESNITYASVGVEALYALTPDNWIQGRAGFIKPMSGKATITLTNFGLSSTSSTDFGGYGGFEIGAGARFGVMKNLSVRADANYISIEDSSGFTDEINTLLTGQYVFGNSPFSMFAQTGYEKAFGKTSANDKIKSRFGVSWSFGGPTQSTRNKLFRSAGVGGVFN
jgi:hypothetical protein